jgi:hypothetical protein
MIPDFRISRETLVYVGFSANKASELWDRWSNWPADGPRREVDIEDDGGFRVGFWDFISGNIESQPDTTTDDDDDWRRCLDVCGMSSDVQSAIMDPRFRYLRLSNSCVYWVKDTVEMRYAGLKAIQETSRMRDLALQHLASRPAGHHQEQGGVQSGLDSGAATAPSTSTSTSTGQASDHFTSELQQGALDCWTVARAQAAQNAPGYITLYKGIDEARISRLFDSSGTVSNITLLWTEGPADFSRMHPRFYFTPDHKVAEYYAAYAKCRGNSVAVVILRFRIPNAAIEALSPPQIQHLYWPNDEWKEFVWIHRTRQPRLPSHLRKYRNALLIIGTIARKPDETYYALKSWGDITERYVLKVRTDRPAVQYVFSGEEEVCDFLMENGARHIQSFRYSHSELQEWLAQGYLETATIPD